MVIDTAVTRMMTRHCVLSIVAAERWNVFISLDEYTRILSMILDR